MVRRVVTGHDEQGRSCVVSDAEAHAIPFGHAGGVFHLVWGRDDVAHFPDRGVQPRWRGPSPPPGGYRVTFMELPPGDENDLDDYVMDELPSTDGARPGMHATPTLDFDIVLTGRVGLELEEGEVTLGPGDVVVLNGALHRWRNRGSTAATVAVFVVGAEHDAFRSTST